MKNKDLIAKLQQLDLELPVCLSDWQEGLSLPDEGVAETVVVTTGLYYPTGENATKGTFIRIGEDY